MTEIEQLRAERDHYKSWAATHAAQATGLWEKAYAQMREIVTLRTLLAEGLKSWSFNNEQQPTHTWHDWADWAAKVKPVLAKAKDERE